MQPPLWSFNGSFKIVTTLENLSENLLDLHTNLTNARIIIHFIELTSYHRAQVMLFFICQNL